MQSHPKSKFKNFPPLLCGDFVPCEKLRLKNIWVFRGARPILQGLNLQIKAGELWAVGGANGVGKSTLLRVLAGLLRPTDGDYKLTPPALPAKTCHYLGHLDGLKNTRTLREEFFYQAALYDVAPPDMTEILAVLGLENAVALAVGALSAGQKRRLTFLRLILVPRPLWLLDEPFTALDAQGRTLLKTLVQAHQQRGGMVVVAGHEKFSFATQSIRLEAA